MDRQRDLRAEGGGLESKGDLGPLILGALIVVVATYRGRWQLGRVVALLFERLYLYLV